MVRTSWSKDPYALGAYSYLAVGATPEDRAALRTSVENRLFFAGEATDEDAPSTVHGALASGGRVAEEIIDAAETTEVVVIIGAGASGLQAAAMLKAEGFAPIVLEARNRIGGRLDTVQPDGWPIPVERGASWVHDVTASDLAKRMAGLKIATIPFDYETASIGLDGEVKSVDIADEDAGVAGDALDTALAAAQELEEDVSIADAIDRFAQVSGDDRLLLDNLVRAEIVTEYGADAAELSAYWGTEEGSEGDDVLVAGGYAGLAANLATGVDVRTEVVVKRIVLGDRVLIETSGDPVEADRVVVTVPIGVLKAGSIAFEPALPDAHQGAIDRIGMGLLDKFWFRFNKPFWSSEALMWTKETEGPEPFTEWFNVHAVTGEPVLLALMGGSVAREWAAASDDDIETAALASLQSFINAGL